jgi:tetratricopeptide (TPR) repeat protein
MNFNRYASPLLKGIIPLCGGVLLLMFAFQEFPQSKSSQIVQPDASSIFISRDPDDAIAYNERGYQRYKRGEYFGALTDLNKAIQINPNLADAYLNRRLVNEVLGNEKLSEQDLLKAIAIDPDNPRVSSFSRTNRDLLKDLNSNTESSLESDLFKLPENKDSRISKAIEKNILLKNKSKAVNSKKNPPPAMPTTQKYPSKEGDLDTLQTLEDYHDSFADTTSLETPDILGTNKISRNDGDYSDNFINESSKKYLTLNSSLASSFLQRGTYYKKLGIYSEAIKNFEQAYLLLAKDGHFKEAEIVEAMIQDLRTVRMPN